MSFARLAWIVTLGVLLVGVSPTRAQPTAYETIVQKHALAMVNIKFILKAQGQEEESEVPGVMIEKTGLVLASTIGLGEMQTRFGGMNITPTNIKILIGDDTQGVDAKMIARDGDLALGWFQIDAPDEKGYAAVDFAAGAMPAPGDALMVVSQLGKFFHRANVVTEGKVSCVTAKPRSVILPSITLVASDFGVPVFDAQSRPVGLFSAVLPDKDELEGSTGGLEEMMKGIPGLKMIIPAAEIVSATARAKEEAARKKAEAPSEPAPATP
ncbi:MAG: hypothetical protein HBSAPP03_24330 [Phycisphaerae bacterium]|nr:MAG: hypothetical protein HBSAPP03_24330 [Phycisphaerae bacterium]